MCGDDGCAFFGYIGRHHFAKQLLKYKTDNGLTEDAVLDKDTYQVILSDVNYELNNNKEKDLQMLKAIEVLNEN